MRHVIGYLGLKTAIPHSYRLIFFSLNNTLIFSFSLRSFDSVDWTQRRRQSAVLRDLLIYLLTYLLIFEKLLTDGCKMVVLLLWCVGWQYWLMIGWLMMWNYSSCWYSGNGQM